MNLRTNPLPFADVVASTVCEEPESSAANELRRCPVTIPRRVLLRDGVIEGSPEFCSVGDTFPENAAVAAATAASPSLKYQYSLCKNSIKIVKYSVI